MQRRGQSEQPVKRRRLRAIRPKARKVLNARHSDGDQQHLDQRTRERDEALEQLAATSEVLQVISSSPGDLKPVFESILANATRICEAKFGALFLSEGDAFRAVALHGVTSEYAEARRREPTIRPGPGTSLKRAASTGQPVQIADIRTEPAYINDPKRFAILDLAGARTIIAVPMLKADKLVGIINIYRTEVRPFTDRQIELVKSFAAQAVIAIENTRLLSELRESLQQQTATSEVLKVISSSRGELEEVFQVMLANAMSICEAKFGHLLLYDGEGFSAAYLHDVPPSYREYWKQHEPIKANPNTGIGRIAHTRQVVHILDLKAEQAYTERDPLRVVTVEGAGARSFLSVPMLKENELIGAIVIYRQEVRPFTEKQIGLLQNFASQAIIAIESARLLVDLKNLNQQLEHRVADQVGEIERMGRLRRFLPPQVADLIVASGSEKQLESHRREITALFCDLRGFTGFSESSDPEDVMALLREYHAAIGEIINKYRGTLERYAGDGVMVVFNDPIPVDNPALQAVLMAIDMRAALGKLIEKWRRLGHDIGFGIGIAHGFATLGTIGFEGRFDYAAIGTVSNVASRLCDEAKPGQILVSPRVLMAVEDTVAVEAVGEFELKGIRRPMAAYNVLAAKPAN
jgi:class 3 adenylate cyclase/putative methionine-R-sulfoxide reductase with GAF domain